VTGCYRRHDDVRLATLEAEGVVLHLGTRRYFTVSESGLTILDALASSRTAVELTHLLTSRYAVSEQRAAVSVRAFLDRCTQANLVVCEDT
jgi:hypothetical protein